MSMSRFARAFAALALFSVRIPQAEAQEVDVNVVSSVPLDVTGDVNVISSVPLDVTVNNDVVAIVPDGVEVTNAVVPTQFEPAKPYQVTVSSNAGGFSAHLPFAVPSGYYLVVLHVGLEVKVLNSNTITARLGGSFDGSGHSHMLTLVDTEDTFSGTRTYVVTQPMTLYFDDNGGDSDFSISLVKGALQTGILDTRATVTGYLVPVGATRFP